MQVSEDERKALEGFRDAAARAAELVGEVLADVGARGDVVAARLEEAGRASDAMAGTSLTPFILRAKLAHQDEVRKAALAKPAVKAPAPAAKPAAERVTKKGG